MRSVGCMQNPIAKPELRRTVCSSKENSKIRTATPTKRASAEDSGETDLDLRLGPSSPELGEERRI